MREKLLNLMKSEGLKPSQLAEILEVNPAGISHILAGRNKPGFDLLQKILRRFPRVNPDWLLLDTGPMYRDAAAQGGAALPQQSQQAPPSASETKSAATAATFQGGLFDNREMPSSAIGRNRQPAQSGNPGNPGEDPRAVSGKTLGMNPGTAPGMSVGGRARASIERIVIFYDDQTCECYFPTRR